MRIQSHPEVVVLKDEEEFLLWIEKKLREEGFEMVDAQARPSGESSRLRPLPS